MAFSETLAARARKLLRQRPTPFDRLVVQVREKLVPGSKYLIRARGATNLNGASTDGQAVLAVPVPKPSSPREFPAMLGGVSCTYSGK